MTENFYESRDDGILLNLRITTGSENFEIGEVNPWRHELQVYLTSQPRKGKANRELIQKFQEIIGRDIELVSGLKSRNKKLLVRNISISELSERLNLDINSF